MTTNNWAMVTMIKSGLLSVAFPYKLKIVGTLLVLLYWWQKGKISKMFSDKRRCIIQTVNINYQNFLMSSYAGFLWVVILVVLTKSYAGLFSSINTVSGALLHLLAKVMDMLWYTQVKYYSNKHSLSCFSHFLLHIIHVPAAVQTLKANKIVTAAVTNTTRFVNVITLSGFIPIWCWEECYNMHPCA